MCIVRDQILDNNLIDMHGSSSIVNCGLRFSCWCCLCLTLKLEAAGSSNMVVATCMMTWSHSLVYCILNNQAVCSFFIPKCLICMFRNYLQALYWLLWCLLVDWLIANITFFSLWNLLGTFDSEIYLFLSHHLPVRMVGF
jgi:hypothetical protein